jgi:hypothetical protein
MSKCKVFKIPETEVFELQIGYEGKTMLSLWNSREAAEHYLRQWVEETNPVRPRADGSCGQYGYSIRQMRSEQDLIDHKAMCLRLACEEDE